MFSDQKVSTLSTQLSWSHYTEVLPIKNEDEMLYYLNLCINQHIDVRSLRKKYERLPVKTRKKLIYEKKIEEFVDFPPFEWTVDGKKIKGNVLYITLKTSDFRLSIETVYFLEWINELKINDKKDISKYIEGLYYNYGKEWNYFSDKCNCLINKINDKSFEFSLNGYFNEYNDEFNIEYDDILKFNNY